MTNERCDDCYHWIDQGTYKGECRAAPPSPSEDSVSRGKWPITSPTDRCASFRSKSRPPGGPSSGVAAGAAGGAAGNLAADAIKQILDIIGQTLGLTLRAVMPTASDSFVAAFTDPNGKMIYMTISVPPTSAELLMSRLRKAGDESSGYMSA